MFFLVLGAVSATEMDNVTNTDTGNLMVSDDKLSSGNLEISESDSLLKVESDPNEYDSTLQSSDQDKLSENESTNTTPKDTSISVSNARYSKSNTVFKVTLKDSNGTLLDGKKVTLNVNGKTYSGTTSNGAAYIKTASLKIGKYTATATFKGDNNYIKSSISKKVKVSSSISNNKNIVTTYGDTAVYSAIFWKDTGRLANTNVKFTVNGKTYTVKTDSKGQANISVKLVPGKYPVTVYNPYSKEKIKSNTITVNKASTKITGSNAYMLPKTKLKYSVVLENNKGTKLKNTRVIFTYNNKQVKTLTDGNGKATITIPALSKGTYTISYSYKGAARYKPVSDSKKLYVRDSTTTLTSSALTMQYNDGSVFSVKATNSAGKALANKNMKITLNGKTTTVVTYSAGVAKLTVGAIKPGTYTVKSTYSTAGLKDYNTNSNTVKITKQTATLIADDLVMEFNDFSNFKATVKNKTGSTVFGANVHFTYNGQTISSMTDKNGVSAFAVTDSVGYYPVDIQVVDTCYTSSKISKHILVNGTKFSASDMTIGVDTTGTFQVKLIDGENKAVSGSTVKFTLNGKTQSVQTDSNGIAKLTVPALSAGKYTVTYTDGKTNGSSIITVVNAVTLKEIIAASQNVKKYIESNEELPNTVKIGSITYSLAEYMYLASQAIINLNNNNKKDIAVKSVSNPTNPGEASALGNLYDYVSVAKSVVSTANSKGVMPNSVSSKVGTIGYDGLVYATARVVAFYDDYAIMPNYVSIKTYASSSSSSSLNSKNTITNLKAYLASSTNCQVGNSKIKSIVNSITSGLTTDKAKATAIYNYVRDQISYSFYYDTKYGAVGTLNAKQGNCVDQAHLLIAMYRTAGLAARYVHGTCYFTLSGSTYGHVWTQVLIGDTWIVGDPTSSRNSFGNVVNWNNYNYNLKGYYASIAF